MVASEMEAGVVVSGMGGASAKKGSQGFSVEEGPGSWEGVRGAKQLEAAEVKGQAQDREHPLGLG